MLKQQLQDELNTALKAKEIDRTNTIRMLFSAIQYFEIEKDKNYEASEEDILKLIIKEAKKRKEAIEMYKKGNRPELAEKEQKELEILEAYLPDQMSEDDIRTIVKQSIQEINATSMANMGKVMGPVMGKLKGKADGNIVSKIVKQELSNNLTTSS